MDQPRVLARRLRHRYSEKGFTIIELVVVLALMGILSAVAFSRFANVSSFESSVTTNQFISYLRLAQRVAVAHQGGNTSIEFKRSAVENWQIKLRFAGQVEEKNLESAADLKYAMTGLSGTLAVGDTLILEFSDTGDFFRLTPPGNTQTTVNSSLQLDIAERKACVSLTGFAYEGSCL